MQMATKLGKMYPNGPPIYFLQMENIRVWMVNIS